MYPNRPDGARDLLPVCPNILHRSSTNGAWYPCETFETYTAILDGPLNEGIPVLARRDLIESLCCAR